MPSDADAGWPGLESRRLLFGKLVLVTMILDRITKVVAERALQLRGAVPVIGDTVQLRLVYNKGAAFGINLGPFSRWIFFVIALIAIPFLYRMATEAAPRDRLRLFAVGFVAGGAAGNALDRLLTSRGVIDYIDIGIGALRWPTFNVADIAVSCGAVALALSLWREDARHAATHPAA